MPPQFSAVQQYMRDHHIDAWLIYDFRGSNAILAQLLPGKRSTTRRAFLLVPSRAEAVLLVHSLDLQQFEGAGIPCQTYIAWTELRAWLEQSLSRCGRVAMEYSPGGALPVVSLVDAGTLELIRSFGVEVVSSANLIQVSVAGWSDAARQSHDQTSKEVTRIKDEAFQLIRDRVGQNQRVTEHDVQQFIMSRFLAAGLETDDPPIVAANAHSGDPHFEVSSQSPSPMNRGDWVLIDLWARLPGDENIYSDITWVGFVGRQPAAKHQQVFEIVRQARDAALARAVQAWKARESVQGWQLDDAARNVIIAAGYGDAIRHRTGHSLSPGPKVHGLGFNLDNLETHDTRQMLPRLGFTIEPGIYLPEFGVRLEIDVFVDPDKGPTVTSCLQDHIIQIS